MTEAQFDLCFDSDWDSSGSSKDPNYDPKSHDDFVDYVTTEEDARMQKNTKKVRKIS